MERRFVLNTWYAAAWAHEIESADNLLARTICNVPLVFYRADSETGSGTDRERYVALDDRCCHRAAPLSMGRVEGNCLRCMYHGILYNEEGRVVEIPGQEHVSENMRVRSYPVSLKGGMVWIWMGDADKADPELIHDFPPLSQPDVWRGFAKESYLHYRSNWMLIVDNLADFTHVAFVHPNTLGGSESYAYESVQDDVEALPTGLSIKRWHRNSGAPPFHRRVIPESEHAQKLDRLNAIEMHLPGVFLMKTRFAPAGINDDDQTGVREYRNCQYMTPETWHTTHFFWNYLHNFDLDCAETSESLRASLLEGFLEDKVFIENQQALLEESPDFAPRAIAGDKALTVFRSKWRSALMAETPAAPVEVGVNPKALI